MWIDFLTDVLETDKPAFQGTHRTYTTVNYAFYAFNLIMKIKIHCHVCEKPRGV